MPVIKAGAILNSTAYYHRQTLASLFLGWMSQVASMVWLSSSPSVASSGSPFNERDLSNVPVTSVLSHHERLVIQYLAAAASTISLIVGLVTVYWFSVMRRSYRHRLIFFLICGDLFRSIWYFAFAWVSTSFGPVETSWKFCQATGFFVQTGNEISDLATLSMSIHTALLVFKPWESVIGSDGLYPFRQTLTAIIIGLPLIMASVAFAHHGYGYSAQLPICTLPVRPFWYRLALQWVPRYIIWLIVLGLAIRVYFYVGGEFRMFSANPISTSEEAIDIPHLNSVNLGLADGDGSAADMDVGTRQSVSEAVPSRDHPNTWPPWRRRSSPFSSMTLAVVNEELAPDEFAGSLQRGEMNRGSEDPSYESNKVSARSSASQQEKDFTGGRASISTVSTFDTSCNLLPRDGSDEKAGWPTTSSKLSQSNQRRPTEVVVQPPSPSNKPLTRLSVDFTVAKRRHAIIRQLRFLFIYPILYIVLWLVPFILHCYQYNDYYAMHPPYALALLTYFCLAIMGAVDGMVFNFKERPWRHIPGSDGTFWGSFCWWRIRIRDKKVPRTRRQSQADEAVIPDASRGHGTTHSEKTKNAGMERSVDESQHDTPSRQTISSKVSDTTLPSSLVSPVRAIFPQRQKRTESEKRQANLAYARLAVERADRQTGRGTNALASTQDLEARRSSTVTQPMSNWWDRRISGLSIKEDVEGEAHAEDNRRSKSESPEQGQEKKHSAVTFC